MQKRKVETVEKRGEKTDTKSIGTIYIALCIGKEDVMNFEVACASNQVPGAIEPRVGLQSLQLDVKLVGFSGV